MSDISTENDLNWEIVGPTKGSKKKIGTIISIDSDSNEASSSTCTNLIETTFKTDYGKIVPMPFIEKKKYNNTNSYNYDRNRNNNSRTNYNGGSRQNKNTIANSEKSQTDSVRFQIIVWGDLTHSADLMYDLYLQNKHIYESARFVDKNVITIFERLAKNWRYDVIKILREKEPNFRKTKIHTIESGAVTPFHRLVWPTEQVYSQINDENIINAYKTFVELLKCGFKLFSINDTITKQETFLKTLLYKDKDHTFPLYFRLKIYDMFTKDIGDELYEEIDSSFGIVLNQASSNPLFCCDKILYFLHKFPEKGARKIITWMCSYTPSNRKSSSINGIVNSLKTNPDDNSDYKHYLDNYDINEIRNNFIQNVILKDFQWVEAYILGKNGINYRRDAYSNLMILYANLYSISSQKDTIVNKIIQFLDYDNPIKVVPGLCFIENSGIDVKNPNDLEKQLLKKFTSETIQNADSMSKQVGIIAFSKLLKNNELEDEQIYSLYE